MKRIYMFLVFVLICIGVFSQANYDAFVGTWVYQKNDTIFKIKLQKGIAKYGQFGDKTKIFGGYYLSVKGVVKENYIKTIPAKWDASISAPSCNIYINAISNTSNYLGFTFYDQSKQHLNGKGILGGTMDLLAPNKLHWKLNEKEGLWVALEGDYIEDMIPSPEEWIPRGFSVPVDVIMTKE
ncbi:DUF6705 family protein [Bacteroides sp. UBA939]|uniref:DUF6705 family protein n=1 Tax=Bacteroides sp. UBA939 TaxID=1946092 RepID=UPI0025B96559|nr:DUF6705 family protein [Bacteroides sp. UBA939]